MFEGKHHMKGQRKIIRSASVLLYAFMLIITMFSKPLFVQAEEEMPDNGIPVVYINIDESQGTIEDMIASPDHSVYCYGTLSIEVPEGFHYSDYPDVDLKSYENLKMSLRGRGNSTWTRQEKKPFKIKLDKKADIFGFGTNKHWALLANAFDPSLLRNRVTFWLSEKLGFEFTPQGVPVDLVLKGEQYGTKYLGSYFLCENIRIDDNRLEIDELEEDDTEMPAITGGYLIQHSRQVDEGSKNRFNTTRGESWANDTPSFDERDDGYENDAQKNYIRNHLNTVEDAIYAGDEAYRELVDVQSAANYWLINTLAMNLDAYDTSSTYIYKKRDTEDAVGKVYWGPVWDFDYAYDMGETYEGITSYHTWMKPLFTDRTEGGFIEEVRKQWAVLRENTEYLIADGGLLDQYYEELCLSAEKDHIINPAEEETGEYSYKEKVENLKTWIKNRLAWLDEHMGTVDELVHTVTYIADGEVFAKDYCQIDQSVMITPEEPKKEGYYFMGWKDEDGNPVEFDVTTDHDITLTAEFIAESEAVQASDIVFAKGYDIVRYDPDNRVYMLDWCVLPSDAYDKSVEWSSSDESIAAVNESGEVLIHAPGTVTIIGTLRNGTKKSFQLIITEDELALPEAIVPEQDVIHMTVGEVRVLHMKTVPMPAKIDEYAYESEDAEIADADFYGVVRAAAEGTTRIHVTSSTSAGESSHTCEAWVTVIVSNTPAPTPTPAPSPVPLPKYIVVSGGQSLWKKGSEKEITLTIKRSEADDTCFSHFRSVQIDGTELVRDTDYTAKAGSTVITVKAACLEKLHEGEHTLTVDFDDGKAETTFTVKNAGKASPNTGDDGLPVMWFGLLAASGIVLAVILRHRRTEA